jgi:predicted ATPase
MQILDIKLLADYHLTYEGIPVTTVNQPRLQSLLAYLLLHRNAQIPRHHLAFTFWPDVSESQARNNLRQMLHQLRRALPYSDRFFLADANSVCWLPDAPYQLDVAEFDLAAARVAELELNSNRRATCQALQSAVSFYTGDLLPSCYEDWIEPERERLHNRYQRLLEQLIDLLEEQRDYAIALYYAQQLLQSDPLREETYLCLMRLYTLHDNRAGALRTYYDCAAILQRELELEPGAEIKDAYKRLLRLNTSASEQTTELSLSSTAVPLIGRQPEWDALRRAWQHATGGHPHFALITGESGIGKTRLAEELLGWMLKQGIATTRTRAYEAEGRLAYSPVTEWLRSGAILPALSKLDAIWRIEVARLLPELLTQSPNLPHPAPLTEYGQRQRFFEALARGILAVVPPLLLIIDDLQWCDPETLEWLHFLLRFDSRARLLIVGTARADEMNDNDALGNLLRALQTTNQITIFSLAPLNASETSQLASRIADYPLDEGETQRLFRETEGNPLFVGEMVRAGIGSALINQMTPVMGLDYDSLRLPPRVYAVIAGRLAHLSARARKVAELGAAVGRAFNFDLLRMAGQDNEEETVQALDELWERRIVREQRASEFDFTHDKLRDVAYAEISAPQRRLLHRRIGQALEALNAHSLDPVSGQIAAQYEQAGLFEQALPYYLRASEAAASVYANDDAIELVTHGLALLADLPPGAKRDSYELSQQLALASLYRSSKGWSSPEEIQVTYRAAILSDKVGDDNQRFHTLVALQTLYLIHARYALVEKTYAQVEQLYMQTQHTPPPSFARIHLAGAKFFTGNLTEGREMFDQIVAVRDSKHIRDVQASLGYNFVVYSLAYNAHVLWCLGYPDSALQYDGEAIEVAREFMHPFNQALAITYGALLCEWCTNSDTFAAQALEAYRQTVEYRAPYYAAWANILVRFADTEQKRDSESVNRLREALDDFLKTGARVRLTVYFSLLARACQRADQFDAALEALQQAFTESLQNNDHWWDAELHRLHGELKWAQGATADEVETAFQRSLEIARSQQARSFELRTATSLARLWKEQDKSNEAHHLLSSVYAWFTEGFDTPDLKDARALLDLLEG